MSLPGSSLRASASAPPSKPALLGYAVVSFVVMVILGILVLVFVLGGLLAIGT